MEASNVKLLPSLSFLEYHNHVLEAWKEQLHLLPASKAWVIRFQLHNINRLFESSGSCCGGNNKRVKYRNPWKGNFDFVQLTPSD